MSEDNNNVVMSGLGPKLLLSEVKNGAKGKTLSEISENAKNSSYDLWSFNENLMNSPKLKNFKTRVSIFVTSSPK